MHEKSSKLWYRYILAGYEGIRHSKKTFKFVNVATQ